MFTSRLSSLLRCNRCKVRQFSITSYEGITLNPKFTKEQQEKILYTLNTCNDEELSRFDVTLARIKSLQNWKNKKGPFTSIAGILEVDGLGVKVLERLCESIVTDNGGSSTEKNSSSLKNRRQFVTPLMNNEQITSLLSAVGLHLGPTCISWAKLCCEGNCLDKWDYHDFGSSSKKMHSTDIFRMVKGNAMTVLDKIPSADAYIFEASPNMSPQANKSFLTINSYNQQMELTSMLLALLNTSPKHSPFSGNLAMQDYHNCVYHLKANLPARMFKTLMGTERVSSTAIISSLLQSTTPDANFTLPCTPVKVKTDLEQQYNSYGPVTRELLGQALLLVVTFMDLCIYRNSASLVAVAPRGRKS